MKIQLYPTYPKTNSNLSPVLELDPLTQKIDLLLKYSSKEGVVPKIYKFNLPFFENVKHPSPSTYPLIK